MGRMGARARDARGQSTVEAALLLPTIMFTLESMLRYVSMVSSL